VGGKYVAGVSKVSTLKRTTEVVEHRRAGIQQQPQVPRPNQVRGDHLEPRVTHDTEFEKWAKQGLELRLGLGAEVSLKDFRKDIIIEDVQQAGQLAIAYKVFRCWVSEYQALPTSTPMPMPSQSSTIKLENEGWERDYAVTEPTEPSYTEPS